MPGENAGPFTLVMGWSGRLVRLSFGYGSGSQPPGGMQAPGEHLHLGPPPLAIKCQSCQQQLQLKHPPPSLQSSEGPAISGPDIPADSASEKTNTASRRKVLGFPFICTTSLPDHLPSPPLKSIVRNSARSPGSSFHAFISRSTPSESILKYAVRVMI